ncbi:Uncharacterised protein [Mycobacteroides abscessus subsp. abscessus]|nr:Uncharacterised protein [Mycobacteroides abscessus subsp. abscessus]
MIDDHQLVGQLLGLLHVVRGQHHRDAVPAQAVDQLPHHQPRVRVHAGGRLVEKNQLWPAYERARQREALLLPARQPPVRGAGGIRKAQCVQ